jgi:Asp-tRNA(Asn)/Glu-tRNA(Gln) amidotransferase A subunit family amidase
MKVGQPEVALASRLTTQGDVLSVRRFVASSSGRRTNLLRTVHPGSSTGSAVAVSAGFAPASIGTETCGSITYPASVAVSATVKKPVSVINGR